jgi:elongation factor Ts
MAEITAALVKELREKTGAGMMECKNALTEAQGDIEEAVKILRKKGLAAAGKKAGRVTSEGTVHAEIEGNRGVLVEVNCETDFVANTPDFKAFARSVAQAALASRATSVDELLNEKMGEGTVSQAVATNIAKVGENISVRRFARFETSGVLNSYIHAGGKIGVMVEVTGEGDKAAMEAIAKDVAMHVAAAEPKFLKREEVTQKDLDTEREVAREQALASGKPEAVVDKIVSGKMEKYYAEAVLLEQPYIRDDKMTVRQLVQQRGKEAGVKNVDVASFTRYKLGEGIEKKVSDFAAEVAAQAGL